MQFRDIIGQKYLKQHLIESADNGRISHAIMFTGDTGYGTLALAIAYAQYINCTNPHNGDSCGECPSCKMMSKLEHPDVNYVFPVNKKDKKSGEVLTSDSFISLWRETVLRSNGYLTPQQWSNSLNLSKTLKPTIFEAQSDEIARKLLLKSFVSEYKVMIIWLPEEMNEVTANKILKILEEPWDKTLFILVSEQPERLLKTIQSRVQQIEVPRLSEECLRELLATRGETDPQRIASIAHLSKGSLLEMENIANGQEDETRKENFQQFCTLMRLCYAQKRLELLSWADEMSSLSKVELIAFLQNCTRLFREAFIIHAKVASISYLWGEELTFCRNFAPYVREDSIEIILDEFDKAIHQVNQNGNAKIILTHISMMMSKFIRPL